LNASKWTLAAIILRSVMLLHGNMGSVTTYSIQQLYFEVIVLSPGDDGVRDLAPLMYPPEE
jgi:hypothetical protein